MTTETRRVGFLPASTAPGQRAAALFRAVSGLASRAVTFLDSLLVAGAVARQAERYYEMNSAELAEIGLTREQIPAVLLRELDRGR